MLTVVVAHFGAKEGRSMARTVTSPPAGRHADGSVPGGWWHEIEQRGRIVCDLCPRACSLKPGDRGFCFVRQNVAGEMVLTTYGRSTGFCVDPIEKKPLNHFFPGTAVLSFGTAGCNLGCKFCQNWDISKSREVERASERADPETIAEAAVQLGCHSVAFTYNDPVIWAEYAIDTASACRERGIRTVAVTAGYITPEARRPFFQSMDAANVDLKAFHEQFYQQLTYSHLQPVLDTLAWLRAETDVWLEITNLLIPRENDSPDEIRRMCDWLVNHVGADIPVHFTAFHPDFRLRDRPPTPLETILAACDIAQQQGIRFVYAGNVRATGRDSTCCPDCSALLIERQGYELGAYHLQGNRCPSCDAVIPGRFQDRPGDWGGRRLPVRIAAFAPPASGPTRCSTQPEGDCPVSEPSEPTPVSSADSARQPRFTEQQELLILGAACDIVVSSVCGRPQRRTDPSLGGAADLPVEGAFVTLKRDSHLRACCGFLGASLPLGEALRNAAQRTATSDTRLPPISPSELPYLRVSVSILHDFREVPGRERERLGAIEVGRHGLRIQQGASSGLLLPSVAVENGWDAETFLRHVGRKAGLPVTAWLEDSAQLKTFEAVVVHGSLDEHLVGDEPGGARLFTPDEIRKMVDHCLANIIALAQGATPNYYLSSCTDANVQGAVLLVSVPARGAAHDFFRFAPRPGIPLQATLFQLCEAAAQWLQARHVHIFQPGELSVELAVLYDCVLHGTVASPDLRGFDSTRRALLVTEQDRMACRLDPGHSAEELLETTARRIHVLSPDLAGVLSLAVDASCPAFLAVHVPASQAGPDIRPPAVAGMFYPGERRALDQLLDQLFSHTPEQPRRACRAIMVPHAGLRYSGRVAAQVWQQVEIPDRVIIVAPKHTRAGAPWAVAPHHAWAVPGHEVPGDVDLARRLADAVADLQLDAAAHREEHAIEVQLPLLARLAPKTRVVGIVVAGCDLEHCRRFAQGLTDVLREEADPPLLVISSDMNHFAHEEENRRLDEIALHALSQLDPPQLLRTVRDHDISMCGVIPAVIVLETLRLWGGLSEYRQVAYATSADAGGSPDRVVGYAGVLFP
jgi:AmmeMemoRadiSam system radical SAM enzyme/AmmeMemoRadiSam system protein B/AmmeMemoRadiSam system protein A